MAGTPHIVYLPGEASIDILESLKLALAKLRPAGKSSLLNKKLISNTRDKLSEIKQRQQISSPILYPSRMNSSGIYETKSHKAKRVRWELLNAGATLYGMLKSESRTLPNVLHPHEHVKAVVYGQHHNSSVMLVATDERIIFLDKKPMAVFLDEVSYEVVSGIEFEIHTLFATLILHTPVKNYDIRYANLHCAELFARHIEAMRLRKEGIEEPEVLAADTEPSRLRVPSYINSPNDDMSGYYWLPNEEEERRKFIEGIPT